MMIQRRGAVAVIAAAAMALTSFSALPAQATPEATSKARPAQAQTSTEFSSHRRRYYRRNAAGAAMMAAIIGGIATYAAAREYRKARERELQYRYGYYGYGAPYGYHYGPRYRYWRGW